MVLIEVSSSTPGSSSSMPIIGSPMDSYDDGKSSQLPPAHANAHAHEQDKLTTFSWIDKIQDCLVYHPSPEEFQDPFLYLHRIAPEASRHGICKVVSPLISSTPAGVVLMTEKQGFKFTTQVQPLRFAKWDTHDKINFCLRGRSYNLRDFECMANKVAARKYCVSGCLPSAYLEREFWKEMTHGKKGTVEYGINVDGSAFSGSSSNDPLAQSSWNLKTLPQLPRSTLRLLQHGIPGITEPMLYIGMLFSMFAWHVEDQYLYSINYHHCGAPKTWYGVPEQEGFHFERVVKHHVYSQEILSVDGEDGAFDVLADKTTMFPPEILLQYGIPVYKTVQRPGEFVITFPRAYHAGFSHGFNCGEAVNFATIDWFEFGMEATQRYALLGRMPVIPFEELACKEAMLLSKSSSDYKTEPADGYSAPVRCLKIAFACLLRSHHCARWFMKRSKPYLRVHPKSQSNTFCVLCKRECYVAHFMCKCYAGPVCLFHESLMSKQSSPCDCGSNCILYLREDIVEMEGIAQKFEEEKSVREGAEQGMKRLFVSWKSEMLHQIEEEYVPFCRSGKKGRKSLTETSRNKRRSLTTPFK